MTTSTNTASGGVGFTGLLQLLEFQDDRRRGRSQ